MSRGVTGVLTEHGPIACERVVLASWAVGVLLLPRRFGVPIARYVCNPASR